MTDYSNRLAGHVATILGQHIATLCEIDALIRLTNAAAQVRAQASSGALFEGYDGAEPQRTQACAAIDELEAAARRVDCLLAQLCAKTLPPTVHHL